MFNARPVAGERFDLEPSIRALLRDLGISPAGSSGGPSCRPTCSAAGPIELSVPECYRFWDALEAEGGANGGRDLAVDIGKVISVDLFSPPFIAALCSPNLATAAHRLAAHKPLIGQPVRLDVDTTDGLTITYFWPTGSTPPALLGTTELVFWAALERIATCEQIRPARVAMPNLAVDRMAVEDYLGTRLRKGTGCSIAFTPADAARPSLTENDQMWRVFAPDLRRRLSDPRSPPRSPTGCAPPSTRQCPPVTPRSAELPTSSPPARARSNGSSAKRARRSRRSWPEPGEPRPALPDQRRAAHLRDRLPPRLRRHQLLLPGLQGLDGDNP